MNAATLLVLLAAFGQLSDNGARAAAFGCGAARRRSIVHGLDPRRE